MEPLRRAYAELTDPAERAQAAIRLSHLLLFVRSPQEGVELAERRPRSCRPTARTRETVCAPCAWSGRRSAPSTRPSSGRWTTCAADPAERGPGARALTAMAALALALTCRPAAESSALAREAFAAGVEALQISAPMALGSAGAGAR